MKYYSLEQAESVDEIKSSNIVVQEESFFDDDNYIVELLCEMQDHVYSPVYYRKCFVQQDGSTSYIDYKPVEESGVESFDVVVEKELKEEKKVIDLRDTYFEILEDYIDRHFSDLQEKAQECKKEAYASYVEDSISDVVDFIIENYYDNYDFDDVQVDDSDIEDMLIDKGILE